MCGGGDEGAGGEGEVVNRFGRGGKGGVDVMGGEGFWC